MLVTRFNTSLLFQEIANDVERLLQGKVDKFETRKSDSEVYS